MAPCLRKDRLNAPVPHAYLVLRIPENVSLRQVQNSKTEWGAETCDRHSTKPVDPG